MPSVMVVGGQWGDEGKGKIIDILTERAQHVVRAQGGNNAGHTIVIGDQEFKLHLLPSGILHPHTRCYISGGTVIDPGVLLQEIDGLEQRSIPVQGRLEISPLAHVILPCHKHLDTFLEEAKAGSSVGTTGRGIGPCYADKAHRHGIRIAELTQPSKFREKLEENVRINLRLYSQEYQSALPQLHDIVAQYGAFGERLAPYVGDVEQHIYQAICRKEYVLFEGAQGTFLDITSGTYPFVTSSNTVAAGIAVGAGIGPRHIDHVLGVVKAYTTRVGNGPLPSLVPEDERFLDPHQDREVGTTTGRPRRAGWLDAVLLREAVRLNGFDSLALTKLDILDRLQEVKICVAYQLDGKTLYHLPALASDQERLQPVLETLPGWLCSTADISQIESLPLEAQNYIRRVEELAGVPISLLSLGPQRQRTICVSDPFEVLGGVPV